MRDSSPLLDQPHQYTALPANMAYAEPVAKDGFHFAGDSLFVEASNKSQHRRATQPELRAILRPSDASDLSIKDPTSHWWECVHL
jgi:hypothetical protein